MSKIPFTPGGTCRSVANDGQLIFVCDWWHQTYAFLEAPLLAEGEDGRVAGDGAGAAADLALGDAGLAGLQGGVVVAQRGEGLKVDVGEGLVGVVVLLGLADLEGSELARGLAGLLGQRGRDDVLWPGSAECHGEEGKERGDDWNLHSTGVFWGLGKRASAGIQVWFSEDEAYHKHSIA